MTQIYKVYLSTNKFRKPQLVITDKSNRILKYEYVFTFSRMLKAYKLQYINLNQLYFPISFLNLHICIYILTQILTNPFFNLKLFLNFKCLVINLEGVETLPIHISALNERGNFWVSREAALNGIQIDNLTSSLEMSINYGRKAHSGFIWFCEKNQTIYDFNPFFENYFSIQSLDKNFSNRSLTERHFPKKLTYGLKILNDTTIIHGKFIIKNDMHFCHDNKYLNRTRFSIDEYKFDYTSQKLNFIKPFNRIANIETAIFVGSNSNYFHFFYECLTRLITILNLPEFPKVIIVNSELPDTLRDLLSNFFHLEIITMRMYDEVLIKKLFVGYSYEEHNLVAIKGRENYFLQIRDSVLKSFLPQYFEHNRFFLRRSSNSSRPLQNRTLLILISKIFNFKIIYPERLSITDQLNLFQNASQIIAEEGAALTNLIFVKSGVKILELQEPTMQSTYLFRDLAYLQKVEYTVLIGKRFFLGENGFARDGYRISHIRFLLWILRANIKFFEKNKN